MTELEAEVVASSPDNRDKAIAILAGEGFECNELDWRDPGGGEHRWVQAVINTDATPSDVLDQVSDLIGDTKDHTTSEWSCRPARAVAGGARSHQAAGEGRPAYLDEDGTG